MKIANYMHMEVLEGRATACIGIEEENSLEVAYVSLAFCSPADQFCRKTGRLIAEGRLNAGKHFYQLTLDPSKKVGEQVREAFFNKIAQGDLDLPYWIVPR